MSHRAKMLFPINLVHSYSCLMLYFWPQASLIWSPLFSRLYISITHSAYSPGFDSMSPLYWSFPRSFHSKIIFSFLNIPTAIFLCHSDGTCGFLHWIILIYILCVCMCVSQKTQKLFVNRNHVCWIMKAKTALLFPPKVLYKCLGKCVNK